MSICPVSRDARITFSPRCRAPLFAYGLALFGYAGLPLLGLVQPAHAQVTMPADFQGEWVAVPADCDAPARLVVTEATLTLTNGEYTESFGDLGIAHSFFGPEYMGIATVVVPEAGGGDHPFLVTFNADERPGVARVDIYDPPPGNVNPAYHAVLERARERSQRFSLDHVVLEKCP